MTGALLLAIVLGAGPAARPAQAASSAPAVLEAQEVRYDYPRHEVVATGKPFVKLTREDAVLTCRKLVAHGSAARQIETAVCSGDVRFVRGTRTVTCDTATYDDAAGRVVCVGGPVVLRDGGTEAKGERLVYEFASDRATLEKAVIQVPGNELQQKRELVGPPRKEARK